MFLEFFCFIYELLPAVYISIPGAVTTNTGQLVLLGLHPFKTVKTFLEATAADNSLPADGRGLWRQISRAFLIHSLYNGVKYKLMLLTLCNFCEIHGAIWPFDFNR